MKQPRVVAKAVGSEGRAQAWNLSPGALRSCDLQPSHFTLGLKFSHLLNSMYLRIDTK